MKFFTFIIALTILASSLHPWAQDAACIDGNVGSYSNNDDLERSDFANCSPFCACECCESEADEPRDFMLLLSNPPTEILKLAHQFFSPEQIVNPIWQPPKLSRTI